VALVTGDDVNVMLGVVLSVTVIVFVVQLAEGPSPIEDVPSTGKAHTENITLLGLDGAIH
jgi:hypothetical protein